MVSFKTTTNIASIVLSITGITLGNSVTTKKFKDIVLGTESSKRDSWDGMKAYPWSNDCGASDGNWEGYTWEGPVATETCYRYWQDGQQVDMYSIELSGNWVYTCGIAGGYIIGWHNPDCDDPIPHPVSTSSPWGQANGCWNQYGESMKSLTLFCNPAPI